MSQPVTFTPQPPVVRTRPAPLVPGPSRFLPIDTSAAGLAAMRGSHGAAKPVPLASGPHFLPLDRSAEVHPLATPAEAAEHYRAMVARRAGR